MSEFNLDKIIRLLDNASEQGINVAFADDELSVRFKKGHQLDKGILEELKLNKPYLIHYFQTHGSNGKKPLSFRLQPADRNELNEMPVSFAQERLWFIDQLEGSIQYHIPSVLNLKGNLNVEALSYAVQQIINRHEVLRTVIREHDGKPWQYIREKDGWHLTTTDGSIYQNNNDLLQNHIQELISQPFNLSKDDMIRANLLKINEQEHVLVVVMHHIASDGWSTSIIVRELVELYKAYQNSTTLNLPALRIQYADFANWQRQYLQGGILENKLSYWKKKLEGVATLQLPLDYERPSVQSTMGDAISLNIDKDLLDKILLLGHEQGTTLFMTLLTVFNVLLYRHTGQQDICVGTPIAGRDQQEAEALIGFFINSLALRNDLSGNPSFIQLLKQVRTTTLEAYDNKELPFEKVVEAIAKERNISQTPVFQLMFVLQNLPVVPEFRLGDVVMSVINFDNLTSKYDLVFFVTETDKGLHVSARYCTDLFKKQTILRLADHFSNLLRSVVKTPHQSIGTLPMLNEGEINRLFQLNDTRSTFVNNKTIIDLFAAQVSKTPESIALCFSGQQLTYSQLNEGSNRLAHYLKDKGIKKDTLVPVFMNRGIDIIIAMLAILKVGAAYVPIDPGYPVERIRYMLEDTGALLVLTSNNPTLKKSGLADIDIIDIEEQAVSIHKYPASGVEILVEPHQLAYVIYTSGSTGKPKGVMVEHRNLTNLVNWHNPWHKVTGASRATAMAGVGFDAFGWELWPYLSCGSTLYIVDDNTRLDPKLLVDFYAANAITHSFIATALVQEFLSESRNKKIALQYLLTGGDKLPLIARSGLLYKLLNNYGPTENTVVASSYELFKNNEHIVPPIGKPILNTTIYLLNEQQQLVPEGTPGEICIGGYGVARGYLNLAELTLEKFISDPFSEIAGGRLYRSGDIGRWLPDGNLEYLGRIDDQVKIRGYRIELGEIETCLLQSGLVSQAVVLAREDTPGSKRLAGYIVANGPVDKAALSAWLQGKLPEYMVPLIWVELENMPLTANGKIDRKALPAPGMSGLTDTEYCAPRTEQELQLAGIWKDLLHVERVGIHDNFFGLGGDSILTIQVVSRARRMGFELQPKDLFMHQTISRLSAAIADRSAGSVVGEQGVLTGVSGLLPIQQWYLEMAQPEMDHFNQGVLLSVDKAVTAAELGQAISRLMEHHDALRFKYYQQHNQWQQEYGIYKGEVTSADLQSVPDDLLGSSITETAAKYQRDLNTQTGELIRVVWMQTPALALHNRLLIVVHHLAIDGVSWRILLDDLELLLTGLKSGNKMVALGAKTSSYRQWYQALEQYSSQVRLRSQAKYWAGQAAGGGELPVDKEYTGAVKVSGITRHNHRLGAAQTTRLVQEVPGIYHTEINDILLAALAATLSSWSGKEKVCIGLEGHGREDINAAIDTSRTVGWFTSLYPLQLTMPEVKSEADLIKSVKEQLRQLPDKGLGYGVLKYICKESSLQGPEPWDIVFNYLGQLDNVVRESKWLSGAGESQGPGRSDEQVVQEKISLNSFVRGGELVLSWNYSSKHYNEGTIEALSETYLSNLEKLIAHCIDQQTTGRAVYTPSDYGLGSEIRYEELDRFLAAPYNGKERRESLAGLYRLSGLQEGMLFHSLYDQGQGAYIEQFGCDLFGVNLEILNKSWAHLINRHSILRSAFYSDVFDVAVQCVYKEVVLPVTVLDYREIGAEEQTAAVKEFEALDKMKGFDFTAAPLMRLGILRLSEDRYRMVWTSHHILFDGWSLSVLMEEFLDTYETLRSGGKVVIREEDRYEDYIRYIERSDKEQEEQYWRSYLQGVDYNTLLPFIGSTTGRNKGQGTYHTLALRVDAAVTAEIHAYAQRHHLTINTLMQGVWSYLLHRYTGNKNIVYGVIVSGRPDDLSGVEQRVGMYINTLPLHSALNEEEDIVSWLQGIQSQQVSSRQYQHTPLQVIQGWSGIQGDLFDTLLTFENYPVSKVLTSKEWALNVTNVNVQEQTNYPLSIIIGSGEQINILFSYNADLLDEVYINKISGHFENVLLQIIKSGDSLVSDINLLTSAEQQQLLAGFNDTRADYPLDKSIVDFFEEQVLQTPDAVAVVFEGRQLSYRQLNEKANQLARFLVNKGVTNETIVPVCMERSLEMMVGILGILKSGAAFVPIDPAYPRDRISYMLEDTGAAIAVSSIRCSAKMKIRPALYIVELDREITGFSDSSEENLPAKVASNSLAYVIYTSGSTGKPKGVMIEHRSLVNYLVNNKTRYVESGSKNKGGSFVHLSFTFDASLTAMLMPLLYGKSVVIASGQSVDIFEDNNLLRYAPYDFIKITPSHLELLRSKFKFSGKKQLTEKLVIGGEALYPGHFDSFITDKINVEIINEYGPTETTVGCTTYAFHSITDKDEIKNGIKIGTPISNAVIYILDEKNKLVPVGIKGEICIGGYGVARGYLNLAELTLEKFISDPFSEIAGGRLYRSGDIGRWLPDGNLEYLGRIDDQVKIRGYRIELGEIETCLLQSGLVSQAVVLAREDTPGSKRLAGYIVANGPVDKAALSAWLQGKLPEYMVPLIWVELENMPLTANGKIDRKALPAPGMSGLTDTEYCAPRTEQELQLAGIWKDLLHVERVGIHDNFFGLGGDSILTIQVVSRARRMGFELQPKDLFMHQTISRLSAAIADRSAGSVVGEQGVLTGVSGLLPIQQWYLEMAQPEMDHFNQGVLLSVDKAVTAAELGQAISRLMEHHDALRFKYYQQHNQWQQEYGIYKGEVTSADLQSVPDDLLGSSITETAAKYQRDLNTQTGELIRVVWMQTPALALHNRLLIVVHHLAIDGVSWRILLDDLELLLTGLKSGNKMVALGAKTSSYRQWYQALEQYSSQVRLRSQAKYWAGQAAGGGELPVDKEYTGAVKVSGITRHNHRLGAAQTTRLVQEVPGIYHTEINDILLAALAATLSSWSGKEKVCIGLEGHGREDINAAIDTSRTVGWFTSLYPLQLTMPEVKSEADLIKSVKEQLRQLPDKGLGYGVLKYICKESSLQGPEPWDIVFNYLGQLDNVVRESKWLSGAGESQGPGRSDEQVVQEKISLNSFVRGGELVLSWNYSSKHYNEGTIEALSETYLSNLEKLIAHCIDQQTTGRAVYTPSDYGLGSEIRYEELDRFLAAPYNGKERRESLAGLYRLSGLQEGMLFHSLYDQGQGAYIEQFGCDLFGVNLEILNKSWAHLINRHSILRSAFYSDVFDVAVQCVYKEVVLPVTVLDYREIGAEEQTAAVKEFEALDKMKGFDFTAAPLMRLGILRLSEDRYRMVWTSHHILFDGWSLSVLMEEFLDTYETLRSGGKVVIREEDRYEDYIRYIERSDKEQEEQYWRSYLQGVDYNTLLPFIGSTTGRNKGQGTYHTLALRVDAAVTAEIHAYAQRHHLTINTLMQGVWSYLLHRYTGNKNIVYGVIVSGRPDDLSGVEQRVGMYINTLPLHSALNEEEDIVSWLQGIQSQQVSSRQYQHTPLQVIQGWSGIQGDLFDTLLTFENYPVSKVLTSKEWALNVTNVNVQEQTNYPLSIIIGSGEQINILFSYNADLLDEVYINKISGHFENVLLQIIKSGDSLVSDINLLTSAEQQQLLFKFNDTVTAYPKDKTIIDLFEEQVDRTPENIAIVMNDKQLTYRELNERSNQFAYYLQSKGVKNETLVPICVERSVDMIVGILGILKTGAAYVPIDPDYPAERILYTIGDLAVDIIISSEKSVSRLPDVAGRTIISLDDDSFVLSTYPVENLSTHIDTGQLAYVIYTSGSTGKPKGVMIQHSNVYSFISWCQEEFESSNFEIVYASTSICFDLSVFELFYPLSIGKPVRVLENGLHIGKYLAKDNFVMINSVPSVIQNLLRDGTDFNNISVINIAGEPVPAQVHQNIDTDKIELRNLYGPTEDTTYSTVSRLKNSVPVTIGKPISNTSIYILNKEKELVPVGIYGEICISGAGLAKGYLNGTELTAEKFVMNPFRSESRMYRTGDWGRWLPDGNIEYLGRMDDQVKVRGYRIELGEIENVLQQSKLVTNAVVLAKQDKEGNKRLVVYVVSEGVFQKEMILAYLKAKLPEYMVPGLWVELEDLPSTPNGKIDRKALPDPDTSEFVKNDYVAPRTVLEEKLVDMWKNLLKVDRIGIYDNFFELGGHSLLAMRMVGCIERSLLISIPIKVLFQFTCINDLSKYLEIQSKNEIEEDITSFKLYDV